MARKKINVNAPAPEPDKDRTLIDRETNDRGDLVALFRLLLKNPPPEHDFKTCPICKRYGITSI